MFYFGAKGKGLLSIIQIFLEYFLEIFNNTNDLFVLRLDMCETVFVISAW